MPEISESKYLVQAGWDDVPHLDEATKQEILSSAQAHTRGARTRGEPSLGAGAIYPIDLDEILEPPFQIPRHWPRAYGMDVGWNRTATLWGAWDREADCLHLYSEYYRGRAEPSVHAAAIRARGEWIPGAIDPSARGRAQRDGEELLSLYRDQGLKLTPARNAVEAGLQDVLERLSTARLKVFSTLQNYQAEYRLYRRDENGKIVKAFDHLMDAKRYLVAEFRTIAITEPVKKGSVRTTVGDRTVGY